MAFIDSGVHIVKNGKLITPTMKLHPDLYEIGWRTDLFYPEYKDKNIEFEFLQSNIEGEIVNFIQEAYNRKYDGIILNAGGYTHTSVAIYDAIKAVSIPTVEVHISNIHAREDFRKVCVTSPACIGQITGLGKLGYILAVVYLIEYYKERK